MPNPVTETVHFMVNVDTFERDGKFVAVTIETGIVTVGATDAEARAAAGKWNSFIVAEAKKNGIRDLRRFLNARNIRWTIGTSRPAPRERIEALKDLPMSAVVDGGAGVQLAA